MLWKVKTKDGLTFHDIEGATEKEAVSTFKSTFVNEIDSIEPDDERKGD
jgi:hypothetical protein